MLRDPNGPWWRKHFLVPAPAYATQDANRARRCPECSASYDPRDRYCPRCHTATPEWRYG